MSGQNSSVNKRFRAHVGDESFELSLDGEKVDLGDGRSARFHRHPDGRITVELEKRVFDAVIEPSQDGEVVVWLNGHRIAVDLRDERDLLLERFGLQSAELHRHHEVRAPMPGLVVRVLVEEGVEVERGAGLVVLEAMKMENEIRSDAPGVVSRVHVKPGDAVGKNSVLIEFES